MLLCGMDRCIGRVRGLGLDLWCEVANIAGWISRAWEWTDEGGWTCGIHGWGLELQGVGISAAR